MAGRSISLGPLWRSASWPGDRDASRSITWSAVSFGHKKMFGMPKFCELRRGRRLITVADPDHDGRAEGDERLFAAYPDPQARPEPTSLALSSPLQMRRG